MKDFEFLLQLVVLPIYSRKQKLMRLKASAIKNSLLTQFQFFCSNVAIETFSSLATETKNSFQDILARKQTAIIICAVLSLKAQNVPFVSFIYFFLFQRKRFGKETKEKA